MRRAVARVLLVLFAFTAASVLTLHGQSGDRDALAKIRQEEEGPDRSQVKALFSTLTDEIGPRLTASPAYKQAADWALARMTAFGLSNAHLEPWSFGRGWVLDRVVVEMVEPRYMPLIGYAEAWSPSTNGEITATPIMVAGKSAADLQALRDKLKGAIVLTQPEIPPDGFIRLNREQPTTASGPVAIGAPGPPGPRGAAAAADARQMTELLHDAGAGVILRASRGEHGTVFVQRRDEGQNALPALVLAGEHYNLIARMLQRGMPVKLRVAVESHYITSDTNGYNVIADLPGADPQLKDEIVMIGAHLDSWHTAAGAADNADGAATTLEALRILRAADLKPRRTIRLALWGGEEEGLLGSKAYVQQHLTGDEKRADRDRVFVYLNTDPGTGPIYGWYLENTPSVQPLFDRWLAPLADLGVRRNVLPGIGSTDHLSFKAVGIPAFNAIQDYAYYDTRVHHTNMDTPERVREQDLKQASIVFAWFAYQAAMSDDRIGRP